MNPSFLEDVRAFPAAVPEPFQHLQAYRIRDILVVASPYDAFILEQDGQLGDLIQDKYLDLDLSEAPGVHRASSLDEALLKLAEERIDLVLTTARVGDLRAEEVARAVRRRRAIPVVVLAYDERELRELAERADTSDIARMYVWQGDARIVLALVKELEDRRNAPEDILHGGVQAILLVEDSVHFISSYLPLITTELTRQQSESVLSEGVSLSHKLHLMRARPRLLLSRDFERAWEDFRTYRDQVLGVISDVDFPRGGARDPEAGLELARRIKEAHDDIPVLLQSSDRRHAPLARALKAEFLQKDSPRRDQRLREFMRENFGFGDFVFRLPDGGVVARARNVRDLERVLQEVPEESIRYHAERNHFSNWLKARAEFALAERLRPRTVGDYPSIEALRRDLIDSLREHRRDRDRFLVSRFEPEFFDPSVHLAHLGTGSLGGKGRGLAFLNVLLGRYRVRDRFTGVEISVPPGLVLATDAFDEFLARNRLEALALGDTPDDELVRRFLDAELPPRVVEALAAFLVRARYPLAVRSSSLLEDSQYRPLAGVYETFMLPNHDPDLLVRLRELKEAVVRVYASTFSSRAKSYLRATPYRMEEERMAVVVQRLTGRTHGTRFYPDFAGTVRSINHYPSPPARAEDGVAAVALGLGQIVVDDGKALRFCPRYPRHLVQFSTTADMLANAQKTFYALDLAPGAGGGIPGRVREFGVEAAREDGPLSAVASTWSREDDAVHDGLSRPGMPIVSFAPILKQDLFPLAPILEYLLEMGRWGMGGPVEIEFAASLGPGPGQIPEFSLLQLRPLVAAPRVEEIDLGPVPEGRVLCRSPVVLGSGLHDDIRDVVYLPPERFDRSRSPLAAREVAAVNAALRDDSVPYLLIGLGRWGSADPWLGVPVTYDMISGARVIVETCFRDLEVTPSQGTHFFQNLTAFQVGYITVHPRLGSGTIDWEWLARQRVESEGRFVRHVRLARPLRVLVDNRRSIGLVLKPEEG